MTKELEQSDLVSSPKDRDGQPITTQPSPDSVRDEKPGAGRAPRKRRFLRWLFLFAGAAIVAAGTAWWLQSLGYESTDDAQIEGHLDSVSSRISGTVTF